MEGLATAAGHQDRQEPLKSYCQGLLLPGERKSIEPMAARLTPDNVQRMRQSLHHLVAKAPWSDEGLLRQVRTRYCQRGEGKDRWSHGSRMTPGFRIAVSLSVSTWNASLAIAYRFVLAERVG